MASNIGQRKPLAMAACRQKTAMSARFPALLRVSALECAKKFRTEREKSAVRHRICAKLRPGILSCRLALCSCAAPISTEFPLLPIAGTRPTRHRPGRQAAAFTHSYPGKQATIHDVAPAVVEHVPVASIGRLRCPVYCADARLGEEALRDGGHEHDSASVQCAPLEGSVSCE